MNYDLLKKELTARTGLVVEEKVPLRDHTSFHIGGPASLFVVVHNRQEAQALFAASAGLKLPLLVIGGGTNLLISDDGFEGLAVKTEFVDLSIADDGQSVTVGASVPASELVAHLIDAGRKGLEFAAGLPGTTGGAVAGNAGCFGGSFGDRLLRATVVDSDGVLHEINDPDWFCFAYRSSRIQQAPCLIVDVTFQLEDGSSDELHAVAASHLEMRRTRHPAKGVWTAGSYFKNLPPIAPGGWRRAAGELLDQVGARDVHIGDAAVFEKHANILVNRGSATASDVLKLEAILKQRVYESFGEMLEPEVRFVGHRPRT